MANTTPTVTLTANDPTQQAALNATLTYDSGWSWWGDYPTNTIFLAGFDVADSGVLGSAAGITIHVKWARSNVGPNYYDEMRYSGPANFNLDTVTPVSLSPLAASPSASSLTDAVLSSGALNLSVGTLHDRRECLSSATSADNQQSAINPIDKALVLTGTWLDNRL
jgi:hypothetical protein